ncbi:MAG: hypothetical protein K2H14_00750 [Muribaculaceae bacterium]|nr:hypothetical protein [Muribaculaceae bacterium]
MIRQLLLLIAMTATVAVMNAQSGLKIAPYFDEAYSSKNGVSSVTVSGDKLGESSLSLYRSVTTSDRNEARGMAQAVWTDGTKASQKEVSLTEGELNFGMFTLEPRNKTNRYILFMNSFLTCL